MKKYKEEKQFRYKGYDYSQDGFYFVTICTKDREEYFGTVKDDRVILSEIGIIADRCWREIPEHFPFVVLDEYVVMPDHLHGIIRIRKNTETMGGTVVGTQDLAFLRNPASPKNVFPQNGYKNRFGPQSKNLSSIIRGFKIGVTKYFRNVGRDQYGNTVWNVGRNARSCVPTKNVIMNNNMLSGNNNDAIWQPRFHDRILRNDQELNRIRKYITDNPARWHLDRNNQDDIFI